MDDLISWTSTHWLDIVVIAGAVCGLAAHVAALTPTPKDDGVIKKIKAFIDFIGGNYGEAKNAK